MSLIDKTMQLKVCAASGDTNKLCKLMVFGNHSIEDTLSVDGESIFIPLCKSGALKAFKFIESMLTKKQVFKQLFKDGHTKDLRASRNCIEYANYPL